MSDIIEQAKTFLEADYVFGFENVMQDLIARAEGLKSQLQTAREALERIANKKWIVEHRPANEMQDIARDALGKIGGGECG